jgi:Zn-finger protein
MAGSYTTGKQPCQNFEPKDDLFTGSGNVHECFAPFYMSLTRCSERSGGTVSFCTNCHRDHHSGGYETCAGYKK